MLHVLKSGPMCFAPHRSCQSWYATHAFQNELVTTRRDNAAAKLATLVTFKLQTCACNRGPSRAMDVDEPALLKDHLIPCEHSTTSRVLFMFADRAGHACSERQAFFLDFCTPKRVLAIRQNEASLLATQISQVPAWKKLLRARTSSCCRGALSGCRSSRPVQTGMLSFPKLLRLACPSV